MNKKPVKIGVLGLGKMGKNHLRILSMLRYVDIRFVYDTDPECLSQMAAKYNVRAVDSVADDFEGVDALFVLTPTSTHVDYVERAIGKVPKLFVEKPLTGTLEDTRKVVERVNESGTSLQVGFIERFNPAVQVLSNLTCEEPGIINVDFARTSKMSSRISDVGVVTDLMIHDIDLALYLNGPVESIVANGMASNGFVDFASAMLEHTNGSLSRLIASRITERKRRLIEVTCMDKFVSCDLLRKEVFINMQSVTSKTKTNYVVTSTEESVLVSQQEALLNEIQSFIDCCGTEDFTTVPTAEDDLAVMEIAEEIQQQIMRRQ